MKRAIATGLVALLLGCGPAKELPVQVQSGNYSYTVNRRLSPEEAKALEDLLAPHLEESKQRLVFTSPELLYTLKVENTPNGPRFANDPGAPIGTAMLVHPQGYFLTAAHVVAEHVREKKPDELPTVLILYSPKNRFSGQAEIIGYGSLGGSDVALGKTTLPEGVNIQTRRVSPDDIFPTGRIGELPPKPYAISIKYAQPNEFAANSFTLVKDGATLTVGSDGAITYTNPERHPAQKENEEFRIIVGRQFQLGRSDEAFMEGEFPPGASGSPIVDLYGRYAGTIMSESTATFPHVEGIPDVNPLVTGRFSMAVQARSLLHAVLEHSRK